MPNSNLSHISDTQPTGELIVIGYVILSIYFSAVLTRMVKNV